MAHPSKRKGNSFEREVVNQAKAAGVPAQRAYASNGEALGLSADIDAVIGGYAIQAKRRAKIADFMLPSGGADIQIIRGDRQPAMVVMRYDDFLKLLTTHKTEK
jgi:hypothetical protein